MVQIGLFGDEDEAPRTEVWLSLAEQYWDLILRGEKNYEYRRAYRRDRTRAFIVTTGPDASLVGYLDLGEPIVASPDEIAAIAESDRAGSGSSVFSYLSDLQKGFAVPIESASAGRRISISEVRRSVPNVPIPQLYLLVAKRPDLSRYLHRWQNLSTSVGNQ
jgi:predicted transcriptional regulator